MKELTNAVRKQQRALEARLEACMEELRRLCLREAVRPLGAWALGRGELELAGVSSTGKEEMRCCRGAKEMEAHLVTAPWVRVALRRAWPEGASRVRFQNGTEKTAAACCR